MSELHTRAWRRQPPFSLTASSDETLRRLLEPELLVLSGSELLGDVSTLGEFVFESAILQT